MWYRDWDTARRERADRERQIRQAALAATARESIVERRHGALREMTAALVRRLGRATLALSDRIDSCATAAEQARKEMALH